MIYDTVARDAPLRQGDILRGIPRIDIDLESLDARPPDGADGTYSWRDLRDIGDGVDVALFAVPVWAIVGSQDCDCQRGSFITLFEIGSLDDVAKGFLNLREAKDKNKSFVKTYKREMMASQKWFYLPPDPEFGLKERMAVDFTQPIRLFRKDVLLLRDYRAGRLNAEADEHFRERLAHYYQRYPFNPAYPLSHQEFPVFCDLIDDDGEEKPQPRPWQLPRAASAPPASPTAPDAVPAPATDVPQAGEAPNSLAPAPSPSVPE